MEKFCSNCGEKLNYNQDYCIKSRFSVNLDKNIKEPKYDLAILIILLIIFFPAGIIYYIIKTQQ